MNIARALGERDDPVMQAFVARIDEINALADEAPGFVWRLQDEEGDAINIRVFDDPLLLVNMSVWDSLDALKDYVYQSMHVELMKNRKAWFDRMEQMHQVRDRSPEKQQQALDDWVKAFDGNPDINNRMRMVLLLTLGSEQVRDIRRARRLVDNVDPLPEAAADRELIVILQQMLDEQGESNRKLSILWKQVTEQNRRIEELEQQLQALTTIEQNIQNRDTPVVIENE